MKIRSTLVALLLMPLAILLGVTGAPPAQAAAGTYYVSATGNDSNSGLSPSQAWRTIAKVNGFTFPQGSLIYFEGGQTFTGCLTFDAGNVPASAASTPFRVYSSGTGQATIKSDCTGDYSAAVTVDNVHGFQLNNLKIINGGTTAAGVLLQNQASTQPTETMIISGNQISGFKTPSGSSSTFGAQIMVLGYAVNGNNGPLNDVRIRNNRLVGASPSGSDGPGISGWGYGLNLTNVTVEGNTVANLGMAAAQTNAGITAAGWDGATIQHNVVHDIGANVTSCGGTSGIETYQANNVKIRFNEVYNVQPSSSTAAGCDWDGIDLDGGTTNSVVEYNYTHHNAGAGFLAYVSTVSGRVWGNNTYRFNISENDDWAKGIGGLFAVEGGVPKLPVRIYGNTFFTNVAQSAESTSSACFIFGSGGAWASGSMITNNICSMGNKDRYGRTGQFFYNPYTGSGMTLSHNLYYGTGNSSWRWGSTTHADFAAWQATGLESGALWGDPLFTAPGGGGTCSWSPVSGTGPQPCPAAYTLKAGSPALGAGVAVSDSGGVDYYQSPLAAPPNVGADG